MQQKGLFAAMMVGALVLASCVKNQESQSVTDVRNARADEIKSQAELNRANAEAAVTLAKAQAAIAAAQAELLKAQQAIVEAEAAKLQVEAELAAVEVEIAKVKLEGERVKLQAKKAELEALIAKYEADIAKYAADKQKAINELEKAEADAEINEIKSQIELVQQKKNLFDAIKALEGAKQQEIAALWASYESEVAALNRAQSNLISAQASLARLEAGEEIAAEILVKQIQDKNAEIFSLKRYIEQLKDNVNISAAQLDVLINTAHAAYETALTEKQQATVAQTFILGQIAKMEEASYAYQQEWNDEYGPIAGFNALPEIIETDGHFKVFKKAEKDNLETGRTEVGVYYYYPNMGGDAPISYTFLPLFTKTGKPVLDYDYDKYFPEIDGRIGEPVDLLNEQVVPAKIYVDNFRTVLPIYKEIVEEKAAADREKVQRQHDRIAASVGEMLERDLIQIGAHQEYIKNASEDINNAIQAINVAKEGVFIAESKYDEAEASYWYFLNNYDGSVATEIAEKNALFAYKESLAKFEKAEEAYEEARLAIFGTPVNDEATNEEAEPIIVEGLIAKVQRLEERAYMARKEAAEAWATLEPLQKAWEAVAGELEDKVTEAENKLKDGKEAVITAKVAAQDKLEAYHWAVIVYTAATDPAKKAQAKIAMDDAEEAYKEAVKEVNTKQDAIAGLETALANAVAARDEVKNPCIAAEKAYNLLDVFADSCFQDWKEAEAALGKRSTTPEAHDASGAFLRLEIAEGIYGTAVTDLAGKYDDLVAAQKDNEDAPEELNKLRTEYNEAYEGIFAARKAVREARKDYAALIFGPDAKYPKYLLYKAQVDPDYAAFFPAVTVEVPKILYEIYTVTIDEEEVAVPGQLAARYEWILDWFAAFEEKFEEAISGDVLSIYDSVFEYMEEALDRIHSEEEAYLESMEVLQEAYDELNDAKIAKADADLDATLAEAAYRALAELKGKSMFVVTPGDVEAEKTIAQIEAYIKTMEEKLVELEKELANLEIELAFGEENGRGRSREYTAARIAELEANIEMYETAIEYHTAQIEYYLEAIAAIMVDPVE